jgi:hypothetical protein|tara:strand:- start:172 stop:372 length:201 start_codon:yes stop_codon:yes gene_type:complete
MFTKQVLPVGDELYIVKRTFPIQQFEPIIKEFGAKVVCANYHCETILRARDGNFYLCDKIDDAQIV